MEGENFEILILTGGTVRLLIGLKLVIFYSFGDLADVKKVCIDGTVWLLLALLECL